MTRGLGAVVRTAALAVVVRRLLTAANAEPPLTAPTGEPAAESSVTIVIPARDESARIAPAIRDALAARCVAEVIVVDDDSVDDTADVASSNGATVIGVGTRPPGWTGKSWAVQCGVERAAGDVVVVLDADCRPAAGLPAALAARIETGTPDLITVAGRFAVGDPGAQWLHAAMLTTLVYRFGVPGSSTGRIVANGQCMAFRRDDFRAWGGFAPVAGSPVEDVALARWLRATGKRAEFVDGTDLLRVEPYETLAATFRGWGRSIGLAGVEPRRRRAVEAVIVCATMPVPLGRLVIGRADVVDVAALAVRIGTLIGTRRAYESSTLAYWLSPLADALAVGALVLDVGRRSVTWSGRRYRV